MTELKGGDDVWEVRTDLCMHGLVTWKKGVKMPSKQPSRFLTNSWCLADALDKKCDGRHKHIELMEGRAADAAIYPKALCENISRAILRQIEYDKKGLACVCRGDETSTRGFLNSIVARTTGWTSRRTNRKQSGSICSTTTNDNGWPGHWKDEKHEEDGGEASKVLRE